MLFVHEPPSRRNCGFSRLISSRARSAAPGPHFAMRANTTPWLMGRQAGSISGFTPAAASNSRYSVPLAITEPALPICWMLWR